jgi:hypothetical protein
MLKGRVVRESGSGVEWNGYGEAWEFTWKTGSGTCAGLLHASKGVCGGTCLHACLDLS